MALDQARKARSLELDAQHKQLDLAKTKTEQTQADFMRAQGLIRETGAEAATLDLAAGHAASAKAALSEFAGSNGWRPALEDLADFAVARRM